MQKRLIDLLVLDILRMSTDRALEIRDVFLSDTHSNMAYQAIRTNFTLTKHSTDLETKKNGWLSSSKKKSSWGWG